MLVQAPMGSYMKVLRQLGKEFLLLLSDVACGMSPTSISNDLGATCA